MASRGLTHPSSGPFSFNGISKLLRNPFYIVATGELSEDNPQPLVARDTFDRV